MVGAIIGIGTGTSFASLGTLSFGDMVCDFLFPDGDSSIGDGESSGGRFHSYQFFSSYHILIRDNICFKFYVKII
jgi:hypothetical protein